jgi:oligopeptidase B
VKWGQKVYRHKLGTPTDHDKLVYEEQEEGFSVGQRVTLSDRFLLIESGDFSTSDIRVLDLAHPEGAPHAVVARKKGNKYSVTNVGERLIVWTNADGASDWKIGEKLVTSAANEPLRELVPHHAGHVIQDMVAYSDHLIWLERDRERGSQRILVRRWSDGAEHAIDFADTPGIVEIVAGLEQRGRRLRYTFQSMSQPKQVVEYDLESRERVLLKVDDVASGHDPSLYVTRRIFAPASDGAQVPVSLLYRRDT